MHLVHISGTVHVQSMHNPCTVVYFIWFFAFNPDPASAWFMHSAQYCQITFVPRLYWLVIENPGEEGKLKNKKHQKRQNNWPRNHGTPHSVALVASDGRNVFFAGRNVLSCQCVAMHVNAWQYMQDKNIQDSRHARHDWKNRKRQRREGKRK